MVPVEPVLILDERDQGENRIFRRIEGCAEPLRAPAGAELSPRPVVKLEHRNDFNLSSALKRREMCRQKSLI